MATTNRQSARLFTPNLRGLITTRYLLHVPEPPSDAAAPDHWPLVLFLHGAGERGEDLNRVRSYGPPKRIDDGAYFPFICVSPQCWENERWSVATLAALLDSVVDEQRADRARMYVTGVSMGGFATWALAIAHPRRFAAIAPVCGGGDPSAVCAIAAVPVWTFHGAKDDVVPAQRTEEMVNALRACGGDVRFTTYPEAGHDSWTETYNNPDLYEWLLSHDRREEEQR